MSHPAPNSSQKSSKGARETFTHTTDHRRITLTIPKQPERSHSLLNIKQTHKTNTLPKARSSQDLVVKNDHFRSLSSHSQSLNRFLEGFRRGSRESLLSADSDAAEPLSPASSGSFTREFDHNSADLSASPSFYTLLLRIHMNYPFLSVEEMAPYKPFIASVVRESTLRSEISSNFADDSEDTVSIASSIRSNLPTLSPLELLELYPGFTPLHVAISQNQCNNVRLMLQFDEAQYALNHVSIDERPFGGFTALMLAMSCEEHTIAMCKLLLQHATKDLAHKKNNNGENLLFVCLRKCNRKELEFWLYDSGLSWDLNETSKIGQTLLHQAAGLGRLTLVDTLLQASNEEDDPQRRIKVNKPETIQGDTALHFAMQIHMKRLVPDLGEPDYGILYRLVKEGGDLCIRSKDGLTCLSFCDSDIVPLFQILDANCKQMPEYLEQLMSYDCEFIETQFDFLSPSERETLWESLQAIREEQAMDEQKMGSCPVVMPGAGRRKKKDVIEETLPIGEEEIAEEHVRADSPFESVKEDAASGCPFLRDKSRMQADDDQHASLMVTPLQVEKKMTEDTTSGGKCPVPFAEPLYNNFTSSGFISGLGVGLVALFLYRWKSGAPEGRT